MSDAESFTIPVKSVIFTRRGGTVGITLVPDKQPNGPGDTFMFGIDIDESNAGACAFQSLWDRAMKV